MECRICFQRFVETPNTSISPEACQEISLKCSNYFFSEIFNHEEFDWAAMTTKPVFPFCSACTDFMRKISHWHTQIENIKGRIEESMGHFTLGVLRSRKGVNDSGMNNGPVIQPAAPLPIVNANPHLPPSGGGDGPKNGNQMKKNPVEIPEQKRVPHLVVQNPNTVPGPSVPALSSLLDSVKVEPIVAIENESSEIPGKPNNGNSFPGKEQDEKKDNDATKQHEEDSDDDCIIIEEVATKRLPAEIVDLDDKDSYKPVIPSSLKLDMNNFGTPPYKGIPSGLGTPLRMEKSAVLEAPLRMEIPSGLETPSRNAVTPVFPDSSPKSLNNGMEISKISFTPTFWSAAAVKQMNQGRQDKQITDTEPEPLKVADLGIPKVPVTSASNPPHAKWPWKCNKCCKSYPTESGLKIHDINHTHAKIYTCSMCPQSFRTKTHMWNHMRVHKHGLEKKETVNAKCQLRKILKRTKKYVRGDTDFATNLESALQLVSQTKCTHQLAATKFNIKRSTLTAYINRPPKKLTKSPVLEKCQAAKRFDSHAHAPVLDHAMAVEATEPMASTSCDKAVPPIPEDSTSGVLQCTDCLIKFSSDRQLKCHKCFGAYSGALYDVPDEYLCGKCNKSFETRARLNKHRRRYHLRRVSKQFPPAMVPNKEVAGMGEITSKIVNKEIPHVVQPAIKRKKPTFIPEGFKKAVEMVFSGISIHKAAEKCNISKYALYPYFSVEKHVKLNVEKTYELNSMNSIVSVKPMERVLPLSTADSSLDLE